MSLEGLAGALILTAASSGAAPHAAIAGGPSIDLFRIGLSLIVCLFIALIAILVMRRRGGSLLGPSRTSSDSPQVLETRRISLNAELCRLQWDGREFLLVVSPQGATVLRERAVQAEAAPAKAQTA